MPPRKRTTIDTTDPMFPTWEELVAEAHIDRPQYRLPLPGGSVVDVPCPSGDDYIKLVEAQRRGDTVGVFQAMFPNLALQSRLRKAFAEADFPILDVIAGKVLRYYFGLPIKDDDGETDPGKSDGS